MALLGFSESFEEEFLIVVVIIEVVGIVMR